jgi:hypothetical protein
MVWFDVKINVIFSNINVENVDSPYAVAKGTYATKAMCYIPTSNSC